MLAEPPAPGRTQGNSLAAATLMFSVFVLGACGLLYELIVGAVSTYLLGSSVTQFSLTVGLFMSSMGLGSYLSKWIRGQLIDRFILIELLVGLAGGASPLLLMLVYSLNSLWLYRLAMLAAITIIGTAIGLEIPLLTRIVNELGGSLRVALARVLALDYVGALIGAVGLPLVLIPWLGLLGSGFVAGFLNVFVGLVNLGVYRGQVAAPRFLAAGGLVALGLLGVAAGSVQPLEYFVESRLYADRIVLMRTTPYQKIVVTQWGNDIRLFLDGAIQFSSVDEHRYHESLVHPGLSAVPERASVLILGGGDGMALREVLKYPDVQHVELVDIDPEMVEVSRTFPALTALNRGSLDDARLSVRPMDAFAFLRETSDRFQFIIVDLPDPHDEKLSTLYSREFYSLVARHLDVRGAVAVQSTSPFFAREAFWCIHKTLESAGLVVYAYHTNVPSFGDWGFNLAFARVSSPGARDADQGEAVSDTGRVGAHPELPEYWRSTEALLPVETRYLDRGLVTASFSFGKDVAEVEVSFSTVFRPAIAEYYVKGWRQWN
ncbi:MAG: polyamine aminopropyltransferase [Candidatus Schekmanbacteria bacterium]|nr:polyamine aminopropyltransferase [Candidatus Schekmanbacteria bacterium]